MAIPIVKFSSEGYETIFWLKIKVHKGNQWVLDIFGFLHTLADVPKSCYLGISKIMKVYEKTTSVTKYAVHVTLYFHFFKIDAMKITLHY